LFHLPLPCGVFPSFLIKPSVSGSAFNSTHLSAYLRKMPNPS
jgi:hypothetical protein